MRTLALLAVVAGCAGALSEKEAQRFHAQNDTAQSRALAKQHLTPLPALDLDDGATLLGDPAPVEYAHPSLGRTVVGVPHADHVFAVDPQGAVHEVTLAVKYVGHEREKLHACAPGSGGGAYQGEPAVATGPAPPPRRRYVRLADGQTLGAPMTVTVEYVELEPVYMTGHLCHEIP